jgi:hypothetical protein
LDRSALNCPYVASLADCDQISRNAEHGHGAGDEERLSPRHKRGECSFMTVDPQSSGEEESVDWRKKDYQEVVTSCG